MEGVCREDQDQRLEGSESNGDFFETNGGLKLEWWRLKLMEQVTISVDYRLDLVREKKRIRI